MNNNDGYAFYKDGYAFSQYIRYQIATAGVICLSCGHPNHHHSLAGIRRCNITTETKCSCTGYKPSS